MTSLDAVRALLLDPTDAGLTRLAAAHATPEGREAWKRLRDDPTLADAAVAAIARSGALGAAVEPRPRVIVEDLLSMLRAPGRGLATLLTAWTEAPQLELRQRAGVVLLARGEPEGLDALVHSLDVARGALRRLSLQALLTRDPASAHDVLSPRFAVASPESADLLYDALHVLMSDLNDDGRAHWGAARRWFHADPRWRVLCVAWKTLPADRAAWGAERAQGIVEVAGWLRKRGT